jgi:hypothetical protein
MAEDPTVEAPEQPQETKEEMSGDQVDALIGQLEAANVTTPEELQGKLEASRVAGQTANLLGAARNEIQGLKQELALIREQTRAKPQETEFDEFDRPVQKPVDIETAVATALRKERERERIAQSQYQSAINQQWNAIVTDKNYNNVKDVWEQKLKDPNFVYQVTNGIVNPVQAYNDTVIDFYKGLTQKAVGLVKTMQGKSPVVNPPNMESNQVPTGPETPMTEEYAKVKNLQKKALKGESISEADEYDALDALLPKGFL